MGKKDFERLLEQRQKKRESVDWEMRKKEWIDHVSKLYKFVEKCLESYQKAGKVQVRREKKSIKEEFIGKYSIEKLVFEIADDTIVLEPIGTHIIGAFGRADLKSKLGAVKLVLVPETSTGPRIEVSVITSEEERKRLAEAREKAEEKRKAEKKVWKVATEPPNISYLELSEDRFFDIMVELLGGETTF